MQQKEFKSAALENSGSFSSPPLPVQQSGEFVLCKCQAGIGRGWVATCSALLAAEGLRQG